MKQAYKKVYHEYGFYNFVPVELTGKCKKVSGGPCNSETHYFQAQRRVFGIPLGKYWVTKASIEFFDPVVEVVYDIKR